jgi:uncharacterized protein YbaP (TraB family)
MRALAVLILLSACRSSAPDTPAPAKANAVDEGPTKEAHGPLLWQIEHSSGSSFVLGTMHLGVAADDLDELVWTHIGKADRVCLEMVASSLSPEKLQKLFRAPEGTSLRKQIGENNWRTLVSAAELPEEALDALSPLAVTSILTGKFLPNTPPLDLTIESRAQEQGKEVLGLENFERGLTLARDPVHLKSLIKMLENVDEAKAELLRVLEAYKTGDVDTLEKLIFAPEHLREHPQLYERLFYERNNEWLESIEGLIARGNSFIAVGAGHLIGDRGLIALLRGRGHSLKRLTGR